MTEDLIDHLLGLPPDHPVVALRHRRPEARRHAEGAFRELLLPADPGGLSHAERAALALLVAEREGDADLAAQYRAMGPAAADTPRMAALLDYAAKVALAPETTVQADIDALAALGLTPRDIVAATQLIAFVPYQVRMLAGLRALAREKAA
ncbi:CMD domain-containing protein [Falsiroseomonas selenitidurans]|uniref:CMD domain protein n=1 Tax=Falsiroseomonas selenitidurans TaxID=2716335 RepID=A0ABX1DZA6_9PROT|nr:hypothetical protein [Falsiroseomonas selenitidurans]NKC30239.1 hypothetical protein [Falsiroseomonas selenitidurans]